MEEYRINRVIDKVLHLEEIYRQLKRVERQSNVRSCALESVALMIQLEAPTGYTGPKMRDMLSENTCIDVAVINMTLLLNS